MLCERCKKNEATMVLTKIINNKKTVTNLCAECAREAGNTMQMPLDGLGSIFSGLLGLETLWKGGPIQSIGTVKKCPSCGMTKEDIMREGKLGCGDCYITFIDEIRPLLRKIHGNCLHHGSVPNVDEPVKVRKEAKNESPEKSPVEMLQDKMKEAIAKEDFETAAALRDQIKELQKEGM